MPTNHDPIPFPIPRLTSVLVLCHAPYFFLPHFWQAYLGEVAMVFRGPVQKYYYPFSVKFYLHPYVGLLVYKYVRMAVTQYRLEL